MVPEPDYGGAANPGAGNVNAAQINAHNAWVAAGNGRANANANNGEANQRIYISLPKWKELNYFSNRAYFLWNKTWDYVDESLTNNRKACFDDMPKTCEYDSFIQYVSDQMSLRKVRICPSCGLQYTKGDGCNKMKCPECSTYMCYICKEQIDGYSHFCQHVRTPAALGGASACDKCDKCDLWKCHDEPQIIKAGNEAIAAYKAKFYRENLPRKFGRSYVTINDMRFTL